MPINVGILKCMSSTNSMPMGVEYQNRFINSSLTVHFMPGSRKFCQRGTNFDVFGCFFLVDEGWENPNSTISGPSSVRWRADDGPTLNAGSVAS